MTHKPLRGIDPDGSHVYENYVRYKPVPLEKRKYGINKPDDPRAARFNGSWFLPLELLQDEERVMPATRPDAETLLHRALCRCTVCKRPQAADLWRRQRLNPKRRIKV